MTAQPLIVTPTDNISALNVMGTKVTVLVSNALTPSYEIALQSGDKGTGLPLIAMPGISPSMSLRERSSPPVLATPKCSGPVHLCMCPLLPYIASATELTVARCWNSLAGEAWPHRRLPLSMRRWLLSIQNSLRSQI